MRARYTCKGKRRHATRGLAEAALRSLNARGLQREEEGTLNVYHCQSRNAVLGRHRLLRAGRGRRRLTCKAYDAWTAKTVATP